MQIYSFFAKERRHIGKKTSFFAYFALKTVIFASFIRFVYGERLQFCG